MDRGTDVQLTQQRSLLEEQSYFCSVCAVMSNIRKLAPARPTMPAFL